MIIATFLLLVCGTIVDTNTTDQSLSFDNCRNNATLDKTKIVSNMKKKPKKWQSCSAINCFSYFQKSMTDVTNGHSILEGRICWIKVVTICLDLTNVLCANVTIYVTEKKSVWIAKKQYQYQHCSISTIHQIKYNQSKSRLYVPEDNRCINNAFDEQS